MKMASTPKLDLTMSAGVLLHYAMARAGLNEDRLKKDFRKQYQLDAIISVKTLPDRKGYEVSTANYVMHVSEYGKINNIKHTGKPRDCRVKEKQKRKDVKDRLKTAAKQTANRERVTKKYPPKPRAVPSHLQERQPDSTASAIIDTIQAEARVPRVYVKRKKDLEPH
jgi:hypothetical protein